MSSQYNVCMSLTDADTYGHTYIDTDSHIDTNTPTYEHTETRRDTQLEIVTITHTDSLFPTHTVWETLCHTLRQTDRERHRNTYTQIIDTQTQRTQFNAQRQRGHNSAHRDRERTCLLILAYSYRPRNILVRFYAYDHEFPSSA